MKLILLTPCDRALTDLQYGVTLVSVFHGIGFHVPGDAVLPIDAVMPKEWAIFTKWELLAEEFGKNYTSVLEIYWPDGKQFLRYALEAMQPTKDGMAFIHRMAAFPLGQVGKLRILITIESDGRVVYGPEEIGIQITHEVPAPKVEVIEENSAKIG